MLTHAIFVMFLVVFASVLQKNLKIPSPLTLMISVLVSMGFNQPILQLNSSEFDELVLFTLPLLITADSLKLHTQDLKRHGVSLFWVAVISVLVSVFMGVLIQPWIMDYSMPVAAIVLLFCMVSATDPITVSAIFSNFKVPHQLKVLTEGESLFNDATALIVFSIALVALQNPDQVTFSFIAMKTFSVVAGALLIGLILGYLTTLALKLSDDAFIEATILLFSAYLAYIIAEHFHFSGILSVIVDMVIAHKVIQDMIHKQSQSIDQAEKTHQFGWLKYSMTTQENQYTILKSIDFVALFASSLLFMSIASIAHFDQLWKFKYEIISVFIASSLIRALMMFKFAWVSHRVSFMHSIESHWWAVLTFAGSKGALSILMVHLIPNSFVHKELFECIIIGNIFLSTFIYSMALAFTIHRNSSLFKKECETEQH